MIKGLKAVGPLVACLQAACFLSGQVKQIQLYKDVSVFVKIRFGRHDDFFKYENS